MGMKDMTLTLEMQDQSQKAEVAFWSIHSVQKTATVRQRQWKLLQAGR